MQFQVPQFIEIEDKIFGPLTLKQFIYLIGGGGLSVAVFMVTPIYISLLIIAPVIAFSLALAFYKFNNKPFALLVEAAVMFLIHSRLYIWRKVQEPAPTLAFSGGMSAGNSFNISTQNRQKTGTALPKISQSKLKDISIALDTKADPSIASAAEKDLEKKEMK